MSIIKSPSHLHILQKRIIKHFVLCVSRTSKIWISCLNMALVLESQDKMARTLSKATQIHNILLFHRYIQAPVLDDQKSHLPFRTQKCYHFGDKIMYCMVTLRL